jgi:hypothetical protein
MLIKKNNNKGESIMNRYRLNTKNFSKAKRGIRGGEYYLEKPCLGCTPDSNAIHKQEIKTYYEIPKELLNKYKKYLPNLTDTEIEVGITIENRQSVNIIFWECRNCSTKSPMKYSNWNKKKGITGNHFKLFELIEDLDDVSCIEFDREWHLEAFEKRNFINIEERA